MYLILILVHADWPWFCSAGRFASSTSVERLLRTGLLILFFIDFHESDDAVAEFKAKLENKHLRYALKAVPKHRS
jgi:hypothetical protein